MTTANLRKLSHVVALGKYGTFAQAADAVHLSQPAFSRSIQSIEEEYDVKLFQRSTRKIVPTPYGKIVIARATKILQEARGLRRDVELMKAHEYGEVMIGMGPVPAGMLLIPMVSRMVREHPKIRTHVEITHWRNLLRLLDAEQLDLFIADTRELMSSDNLEIIPLPELHIGCFCRAGHPILKSGHKVPVEKLHEYPMGAFRFPDIWVNEVMEGLRFKSDPRTLLGFECDNLLVLEQVALSTDIIVLGPASAFRARGGENRLVEIKLNPPLQIYTHFGIVVPKERMRSPAAERFIQYALEEMPQSTKRVARRPAS
ncbi:LysR family transcriptional regulator [Castellaniella sp. GW247-6E4]|uniref:LysR family transcriptional regulator n=1 Tax=Castellaniella sp. GW247-6E4 TaxID=3140380 RepID=UPI0033153481